MIYLSSTNRSTKNFRISSKNKKKQRKVSYLFLMILKYKRERQLKIISSNWKRTLEKSSEKLFQEVRLLLNWLKRMMNLKYHSLLKSKFLLRSSKLEKRLIRVFKLRFLSLKMKAKIWTHLNICQEVRRLLSQFLSSSRFRRLTLHLSISSMNLILP